MQRKTAAMIPAITVKPPRNPAKNCFSGSPPADEFWDEGPGRDDDVS